MTNKNILPTCFNTMATDNAQAMAENGCRDCDFFDQCNWSDGLQELVVALSKENMEMKLKLKILPNKI